VERDQVCLEPIAQRLEPVIEVVLPDWRRFDPPIATPGVVDQDVELTSLLGREASS
jgi:hypothetical protein